MQKMRNVILFDPAEVRENLLPLTYTRPVALIRHGIMTIAEKWSHAIEGEYSFETQDYLSEKYPVRLTGDNLFIAGNIEPDEALTAAILALNPGESLTKNGAVIAPAACATSATPPNIRPTCWPSARSTTSS